MANGDLMQRGDLWIFAYGSLIWNPGFPFVERRTARLDGFQRRFALTSRHYRGTPERPGLVLGLDYAPGHSCVGVAYRICPFEEQAVRDYLVERELVSYAYFETRYPVTLLCEPEGDALAQGQATDALCYVVDRSHPQYAGPMAAEEQAQIIAQAVGPSGPNAEYLENTLAHLKELGIDDPDLDDMAARVRALKTA
ncbi:MAG: gamma-glutamylcyclotransferase [Pseudomonadota bacterium]